MSPVTDTSRTDRAAGVGAARSGGGRAGDDDEPRSRRGRLLARAALGVLVAAMLAMWVYAFLFAPRTSPDRLPDRAWGAAAEAVCAPNKASIDALPAARSFKNVQPLDEALRRRADVGEQATNLVAERVVALRALPTTDAKTVDLTRRWLGDYDTYIADRRRQIARWRNGENPPFTETASERGGPTSDRMDAFAALNRMPSCKVPLDIG